MQFYEKSFHRKLLWFEKLSDYERSDCKGLIGSIRREFSQGLLHYANENPAGKLSKLYSRLERNLMAF